MIRFVFISDTHGLHDHMLYKVEEHIDNSKTNILIHAGDCTNVGSEKNIRDFIWWFQNVKGFDQKIFIAGNHDWGFERKEPWLNHYINDENLSQSDCTYLEDSELILNLPEFKKPIKIYGTPWQPDFFNWAFNVPRDKLHLHWEKIPLDTDILITHAPPFGILDHTMTGVRPGCESLLEFVEKIKPKINVFGHIHHSRGILEKENTIHINACICTESYKPTNKPIVIDYDFDTNESNFIII